MPKVDPPVAVLSCDEKTGIQGIATMAPDLPPKPGKHVTVQHDHEYKQLGNAYTFRYARAGDTVSFPSLRSSCFGRMLRIASSRTRYQTPCRA